MAYRSQAKIYSWSINHTIVTLVLSLVVIFCIISITILILMSLFIYYRKEPEIKATSYTLSLCMFVGCYLLLTSALFYYNITSGIKVCGSQESLWSFICMFDITTVGVGTDISDCKDPTYSSHLQNIWNKVSSFSSRALFTLLLFPVM